MPELTIDELPAFRRRFEFGDGLLREVRLRLLAGERTVVVVVSVREAELGWVNLALTLEQVAEYRFALPARRDDMVLAGAFVGFLEGQWVVALDTWDDELTVEQARAERCYVGCGRFRWEVLPYAE